jgi:hypothetical protein
MKLSLGPFGGMNNRAEDHALSKGSDDHPTAEVRNAVSVDFTNAGKIKIRSGSTKKYSGFNVKYGFACSQGQFIVENTTLKKVSSSWTTTNIATGILGDTFAHYEHNNELFFSDGLVGKKIINSVAQNWGISNPPAPVVYSSTGIFGAGVYLCCLTFYDALGNESGASNITSISVTENSSIIFTSLPASSDSQVTGIRLYMTTANGQVFYQCGDVAIGTLSYQVSLAFDGGKNLATQFMTKPLAGQIIREHNGRLLIAKDNLLYVTEAYSTDLVSQLSNSYFQFSADLTVVEPVDDGVWIVADKTYFFAGTGPENFQQLTKLEYGATLGTGQKRANGIVYWFSTRGLIMAGNGGEIKNLQENQVAPDYSDSGALLIREENGMKQAIASLKDSSMSTMAASSWITAEQIRRDA